MLLSLDMQMSVCRTLMQMQMSLLLTDSEHIVACPVIYPDMRTALGRIQEVDLHAGIRER